MGSQRPSRRRRAVLATAVLAVAWPICAASQPPGNPDANNDAPPPNPPRRAGADQPVKVESPEQAAKVLNELIREIGLAEAFKLDFSAAKKAFEKLEAVRPFADKLDKKHKNLLNAGLGGIGLIAGEPKAALEGSRFMTTVQKGDTWAIRAYMAAQFLGDVKSAKEMLVKMKDKVARALAQNSNLLGKRIPVLRLDLMDQKTFRLTGQDKVVVFHVWALFADDAYSKILPGVKKVNEKFKRYRDFAMVGVNLNAASDRRKVIQYIREKNMRWMHYCDGKGLEGELYKNVLELKAELSWVVVGPGRRVLFKGPADPFLYCAIQTGLRQLEKKRARRKVTRPVTPAEPPATSQPESSAGPTIPVKPPPDKPVDKAARMFNLAETYRAAGLKDKADALLRQLIREFPDSPQAGLARAVLAQSP